MQTLDFKYLKFIDFKELSLWDVKRLFNSIDIFSKYKLVLLSDVLEQVQNYEKLEDFKEYKLCGISSYGKGLFHREIKKGNEIKASKLNKIKKGQFIYSRLGASNGSFGIITEKFDGYYVTNEFPIFDIVNNNINLLYLDIIFKIPYYWNIISRNLQGAAHKRFKEDLFLNLEIPLPPLEIQNKLVQDYKNKIEQAKQKETEAEKLEKEIENYLMEELGIEIEEKQEKNTKLQFIEFKNLFEWGVEKNIGNIGFKSNKFTLVNFERNEDLYLDIKRGKSPKYKEDGKKIILNQKCNRWNNIDLQFGKYVDDEWLKNIDNEFFTRKGDILINSTGEGTIGRASVIKKGFEGLLFDSHLLLLRVNKNILNSDYFVLFFNSKLGQKQVDLIKSAQATKQTELGVSNLKKILFPLPPLKIQEKIIKHIGKLKEKIKNLKNKAEELRKNAKSEFEREVFSK